MSGRLKGRPLRFLAELGFALNPMTATSPIGFGIIGLGMIADFHAQAIREAEGAVLVGAAGRSAEKARLFARKHGAHFAPGRVEDLLDRPDVQVVCITTPSGAHLEPALAAIRAGKHVMVEKPLEITLERVDRILRAADESGVRVAGIFQARFGPGARAIKTALAAGRFGRLVLASAYFKWHRAADYYRDTWKGTAALDGGGALINQGIHAVDLLQSLVGMPAEVFAWQTRRVHTQIEVEDTVVAALHYPEGSLGVIEATTASYPGWRRRIEISGETGSVRLEDDQVTLWDFQEARPGDEEILQAAPDPRMRMGSAAPNQMTHHGHLRQIQDLVDSLRAGRSPMVDGREARNSVALVRAVYESAESGRPVTIG